MSKERRKYREPNQQELVTKGLMTIGGVHEIRFHQETGKPSKNSRKAIKNAVKNGQGLVYIDQIR